MNILRAIRRHITHVNNILLAVNHLFVTESEDVTTRQAVEYTNSP